MQQAYRKLPRETNSGRERLEVTVRWREARREEGGRRANRHQRAITNTLLVLAVACDFVILPVLTTNTAELIGFMFGSIAASA